MTRWWVHEPKAKFSCALLELNGRVFKISTPEFSRRPSKTISSAKKACSKSALG